MSRKAGPMSDAQSLHLVFGGELVALGKHEFREPERLDIIGIYPSYEDAHLAWKGAAQRTVDNAMMRYFIIPIHRLIDPLEAAAGQGVRR